PLQPFSSRIHAPHAPRAVPGIPTRRSSDLCRLPVLYNPDAPPPTRWLAFLDGLLYSEDIPTLQEFIGYCLIPSNKGQRMMVIKGDRKSTRLNSSHVSISYAVFCLKKQIIKQ